MSTQRGDVLATPDMADTRDAGEAARVAVALPAGLASMEPGPELAVLLAGVDRARVAGDDLTDVVAARARLAAYVDAELLADLWEAARAILNDPQDGVCRYDEEELIEYAARVLGWVLRCSENYAHRRVMVGRALAQRLPMVRAALRCGHIDSMKAMVIAEMLMAVADDDVARLVATKVLRKAHVQTLAQLRAGLRYHIDRHDPQSSRRRYKQAVVDRGAYLRGNDDGTANISIMGLPPHLAAQAYDRVDRIARAARADGDGRTIKQLGADVAAHLLAGVPFPLRPSVDPVTHEADLTEPRPHEQPTRPIRWATTDSRFPDPDGGGPGPVWGEHGPIGPPWRDTPPDRGRSHLPWRPDDRDEPPPTETPGQLDLYDYDRWCVTDEDRWLVYAGDQPAGATGTTADDPDWWTTATSTRPDPPTGGGRARDDAWSPAPYRPEPDAVLSPDALPGDRCTCGGRFTDLRPGTVDIQVKLTTLTGLDEHPGLIAGLDTPLIADLARHVALDPVTNPTWRWSIFDAAGDLLHHGTTRHRPTTRVDSPAGLPADSGLPTGKTFEDQPRPCTCPRVQPAQRRSTVELQLTPTTLAELAADPTLAPGWEHVIADIATQAAADARLNPPGKWTETDADGNLKHHGHTGRMPTAAEAALIRARDHTCRTPGCPVPSRRCDLDHRIEYANGGPSHRGCVSCLCRAHHRRRHRKGFAITKAGRTVTWTIPCGRSFDVGPDKDLNLTEED